MTKIAISGKLLLKAALLLSVSIPAALAEEKLVGMLVEKEQTATYTETLVGFHRGLARAGVHYRFLAKNAQNDRERMKSIAVEFASNEKLNAVVVLGSAASAIAAEVIKDRPVVVGGINHPGKLGIAGENVTGTTYHVDPETIVNLISRLDPDVKRVGILYEPAEQNAASAVEVPGTEKALNSRGIEVFKEAVRTKEDISERTRKVIEAGVEYLVIPTNQLLYSNIQLIRDVSDRAGVPLVSYSRKGVAGGATVGLTSDNRALGEKMALILMDIIEKSKAPRDIEWYFPQRYSILVNERARTKLGVLLPTRLYRISTILDAEREGPVEEAGSDTAAHHGHPSAVRFNLAE